MAINTVLFDFDGTLLDTNELILKSFQHIYKELLDKDVTMEEVIPFYGEVLSDTLDREYGERGKEALETYRAFQYSNFEKYINLFENVEETLEILKEKRYKIGIVTSRLCSSTKRGLKYFGLEKYFEVIVGSDTVKNHKPDPEPAFMALEKLDSKPEEAILIGDSPFDVLCAKNAGITSVAVSWSVHPRDKYAKHEPDYIIDDMKELINIIEERN